MSETPNSEVIADLRGQVETLQKKIQEVSENGLAEDGYPPVGSKVFIRTVTMYYTGLLVGKFENELVIDKAAWVANTGRFQTAIAQGSLSEIEPYPDGPVTVNRGAIVDVCLWNHKLPRHG